MMTSQMDKARKTKDKAYKNVFKGSVLISSLIEQDEKKFKDREAAVKLAQRLLNAGTIKSVVNGATEFEDSSQLYHWSDETVVRDAKRLVTTTSSQIPRKKLIELIDLKQGPNTNGTTNGFYLKDKKSTFENEEEEEPVQVRSRQHKHRKHRERADRRKTIDTSQMSRDQDALDDMQEKGRTNLNKEVSLSDDHLDEKITNGTRSLSPSSYCDTTDNEVPSEPPPPVPEHHPHVQSPTPSHSSLSSPVCQMPIPDESKVEEMNNIAQAAAITSHPPSSTQQTVVYDGIEMSALDLERYSALSLARDPAVSRSLAAIHQSIEDLAGQSGSYSDNEKQLLEQMKKMKLEHAHVVKTYEDKINSLMVNVHDLKTLAEKSAEQQNEDKREAEMDKESDDPETKELADFLRGPVKKIIPPPAPPPPMAKERADLKLNKPKITPTVKMRGLFWTRIVLNLNNEGDSSSFWHGKIDCKINVPEFEKLFGEPIDKLKPTKSLHDTLGRNKNKTEIVKVLDESRSRAVGIRLKSLNCQLDDIKHAIYSMSFRKVDLDTLYSLYEIRGDNTELTKIKMEMQKKDVTLDLPEEFLLALSEIEHFPDRMECLQLKKKSNEQLFEIDQQLEIVQTACEQIQTRQSLHQVLRIVLVFGNYMNGATKMRGQADGYELSILTKLTSVKSMCNNQTLLDYIALVYSRQYEEHAGMNDAENRMGESSVMSAAAQVCFEDISKKLNTLNHSLNNATKKVAMICESGSAHIHPFKERMETFIDSALEMIKSQQEKLAETEKEFNALLKLFCVKTVTEQVTLEQFFNIWYDFLESFKIAWSHAQKTIARAEFEKVEAKRKNRIQQAKAKRRKSVVEDKQSMKNRFSRRGGRDAEGKNTPVNSVHQMVRSQSFAGEMADVSVEDEYAGQRRRSRSRPRADATSRPRSEEVTSSSSQMMEDQPKVRMADRMNMNRRRRSQLNSDEVISSIVTNSNNQVPITPQYNNPERTRARSRSRPRPPVEYYEAPPQDLRQAQRSDAYYHPVSHNNQQHQQQAMRTRQQPPQEHTQQQQQPQQQPRRRRDQSRGRDAQIEQPHFNQTSPNPVFDPASPLYPTSHDRQQYIPPAPTQTIQQNPRRRASVENMYDDTRIRGQLRRQRSHDVLVDTRSSSPSSQASSQSSAPSAQMNAAPISPQYAPPRRRSSNTTGDAKSHVNMTDDAADYRDKLRQYSRQHVTRHRPSQNNTLC